VTEMQGWIIVGLLAFIALVTFRFYEALKAAIQQLKDEESEP